MIDRIAKLLTKAEHAATPHEAQAYFAKAQALATAHSLSLAAARAHAAGARGRAVPVTRTITIGEARRHANRHLVRLFAVVGSVNGLQVDVARNSTYVIAYGFSDDIDATELLWGTIATQMVRFAEQYLATDAWHRDQRVVRRNGRHRLAAMTRQTARATYYEAFIETIHERLTTAHADAVRRSDTAPDSTAAGAGATTQPCAGSAGSGALVLRQRDEEVASFYRSASQARGSWTGRSSVHGRPGASSRAGSRDARRVRLGSGAEVTGPPAALTR